MTCTTLPNDPAGTLQIGDSLDTLAALDHYNQWVFSRFEHVIHGRVLEVGSGTGNISRLLRKHADEVFGVEPVADFHEAFQLRFANDGRMQSIHGYLHEMSEPTSPDEAFNCVVSSNVVEHIEDDVEALTQMKNQVCPGGIVVTFVPAGPWAFGKLDAALGHYRRYTLTSLRRVMTDAGLIWQEGAYFNMVGSLGWWLNSVVLGRREVPAGQASMVNRLVPFLRRLESIVKPRFGQSVYGIAQRPL
ncbi:MAG: class I SAM-dependent methyltransferase, partial [Rhodospirillales bacterium]|nr:class I SAM-dependent methyltransferase [Rhodospirillales bacterium]